MDKIETSISITGIRSDCVVGTAVAHDGVNFIPANPYWTTNSTNNQIEPAHDAYIAGILMSKNIDGSGTLLLQGAITDPNIISILTGNHTSECGEYYLAANGVLQKGVDTLFLPVFCGTLVNANLFIVNLKAPEFCGHTHTLYPLTSGWAGTSTAGYGYKYNPDTTAEKILAAVPAESIAVISGGALMNSNGYAISGGALYVTNPPGNTEFQLSPINRLISTDPEIRAIAPADGNDVVKVSKVFGTVYVDTDFTVTESTALGGKAVTAIDKTGVTVEDVVQKVDAGPGIRVTPGSSGGIIVENTSLSPYLDLQAINADNVLVGIGANQAVYTFPAGTTGNLVGTVRLPAAMDTKKIKTFAWMENAGGEILAYMQIQSPPPASGGVLNTTVTSASIPAPQSATEGSITECVSSNSYAADGNSLVTVKFTATPAAANIQVKAIGIKLVDA